MTNIETVPTIEQIDAIRRSHIEEFPDFPSPGGVLFRDITRCCVTQRPCAG